MARTGPPLDVSDAAQGALMATVAIAVIVFVWWTWRQTRVMNHRIGPNSSDV